MAGWLKQIYGEQKIWFGFKQYFSWYISDFFFLIANLRFCNILIYNLVCLFKIRFFSPNSRSSVELLPVIQKFFVTLVKMSFGNTDVYLLVFIGFIRQFTCPPALGEDGKPLTSTVFVEGKGWFFNSQPLLQQLEYLLPECFCFLRGFPFLLNFYITIKLIVIKKFVAPSNHAIQKFHFFPPSKPPKKERPQSSFENQAQ